LQAEARAADAVVNAASSEPAAVDGAPGAFEKFPPLQPPETYNLSGIMDMVKKAGASHPSEDGPEKLPVDQ
jgi:hypothetical protein